VVGLFFHVNTVVRFRTRRHGQRGVVLGAAGSRIRARAAAAAGARIRARAGGAAAASSSGAVGRGARAR
jgi:hypothetical protein